MKLLRYNNKLIILDGRDPMQFVDLATKKLYKYPAIYLDEASEWPVYKWYRNPIKWRQWRKVLKIAEKNTKVVLMTTKPVPNNFYKQEYPGDEKK